MKAWHRLRDSIRNMRIAHKLLLSYVLLIMLPVSAIAIITYEKSSAMVEERVIDSTHKSFEQANGFISYKLSNVKDVSSILYMNSLLNEILSKPTNNYPLGDQIDDYNRLTNILRSGLMSSEIYSIRLYVSNDTIFSNENMIIHSMSTIEDQVWYKDMMRNMESIYCRPTYEYDYKDTRGLQRIVSCVRPLAEDPATGKPLGVLSIDVQEESIRQIIDQTDITQSGEVYLLDSSCYVISALDPERIGTFLDQAFEWDDSWRTSSSGSFNSNSNGENSIIIHEQLEGMNWKLVAIIPQEEILGASAKLSRDMIVFALIVIVLSILTAIGISTGITRRIRELFVHIKHIEKERFDYKVQIESKDEIGLLQQHFNRLSINMKWLIQEKYQAEVAKKNAELQALQAQINPHFLYNTLELIHWMAMKHKATEISDVVGRLAKFFRLSLSKGKDVIPISDEIEHVRTYLDIQSRRFSGKVKYELEMDPDVLTLTTVKLILQPLAENAILHGILEKEDKSGLITIRVQRVNGEVIFEVIDDGVGMTEEELERLNELRKEGGYGVRNVSEKIKLYYGASYGLTFTSTKNAGTTAAVRIPVVFDEA